MTSIVLFSGQLVAAGFLMGTGFWLSRKMTNVIDEKMFIYDKRKLKKLEKEMELTDGPYH